MALPDKDFSDLYDKLRKADALAQQGDVQAGVDAKAIAAYIKEQEQASGPQTYGPSQSPNEPAFPQMDAANSAPSGSSDVTDPKLLDLAKRGVDVRSGSPVGNAKASFSPNMASRVAVYEKALSSHYNRPTKVTVDEASGKLVYTDPKGGVHAIADSIADPMRGGVAANLGGTLPAAGAVAGSMTPMPFVGGIAGATGGKFLQGMLGKALGADEAYNTTETASGGQAPIDSSIYQPFKDAGKEGIDNLVSALPWMGAAKLPGLSHFFLNGFRPFNSKVAEDLMQKAAKSDKLVDEVKALGAKNFNPDMAQRSGNIDALRMRESVIQNPKYNAGLLGQQQTNTSELQGALGSTIQKAGVIPRMKGAEGAQATADQLRMSAESFQARTQGNIDAGRSVLDNVLEAMPNTTKAQLRDALTPAIINKTKELDKLTKTKYFGMDVASKQADPIPPEFFGTPGGADWRNLVAELKAKSKTALTEEERKAWHGALPSIPGPVASADRALLEDLKIPNDKDIMNISDLNAHIKHLREKIRDASEGNIISGQATPKLIEMKDAAVLARAEWLRTNNPKLLAIIEDAEQTAKAGATYKKDMISNGFIKSVHGETEPETKAGILDPIIRTGDTKAAAALRSGVAHDPQALEALDNFSLAYFRRLYKENKAGERNISPGALDKAESDTIEVLKSFMSPGARQAAEKSFDLQKYINGQSVKLKNTMDEFNKSFEGRISNLNGEGVTAALFNEGATFGANDAYKLKKLTEQIGTYEATKSSVLLKLREKLTGANGEAFDPSKLGEVVNNKDVMTKLGLFVSPQFTKDLRTLYDGFSLNNVSYKGAVGLPSERNTYSDVMRFLWAHPLTMEGRALTLLQGMRKEAYARAISNGLKDEKEFRKVIQLSKAHENWNGAMALASSLNAGAATLTEDNMNMTKEAQKKNGRTR